MCAAHAARVPPYILFVYNISCKKSIPLQMHVIVGRRNSGKTREIIKLIGAGDGALVVVHSKSACDVYRSNAPHATVLIVESDDAMVEMSENHAFRKIVFDGAELRGVRADIASFQHPALVPMQASGELLMLSMYAGENADNAMYNLRRRFIVSTTEWAPESPTGTMGIPRYDSPHHDTMMHSIRDCGTS